MRLAVVGASGRMGRAVVRLGRERGIEIVCAVGTAEVGRDVGEVAGIGRIGVPVVESVSALEPARAHVAIDFSSPAATGALAAVAAATGTRLVSGTTGLGPAERASLDAAAKKVAVLWEPNMSVGVHVLARLLADAAAWLAEWDVEIVETHHRAKVDAPSGTAVRLAETVAAVRREVRPVHGRSGLPGPRAASEIGVHAVRGGDVVGDHVVHLLGEGERVELTHRATNRDVFAHGALRAAAWIASKPAGLYALRDVLDVRT